MIRYTYHNFYFVVLPVTQMTPISSGSFSFACANVACFCSFLLSFAYFAFKAACISKQQQKPSFSTQYHNR